MWVIRQCLHIDINLWFIHKNKIYSCVYMEVWAPENLIFSPVFIDDEA